YLHISKQINLHQNRNAKFKIYLIILLICYRLFIIGRFILLSNSDLDYLILYNAFYHLVPKATMNKMEFLLGSMTVYFYYKCYLNGNDKINKLLNDVLFHKKAGFFLVSIDHGVPVCDRVRKFSFVLVNQFQMFTVMIGMCFELL